MLFYGAALELLMISMLQQALRLQIEAILAIKTALTVQNWARAIFKLTKKVLTSSQGVKIQTQMPKRQQSISFLSKPAPLGDWDVVLKSIWKRSQISIMIARSIKVLINRSLKKRFSSSKTLPKFRESLKLSPHRIHSSLRTQSLLIGSPMMKKEFLMA